MKNYLKILAGGLAMTAMLAVSTSLVAEDLVILHTNDTHSLIDPDEHGQGGVLQRQAIIDSIRKAEKNVILVDAGDMVQGTLYFKFFKGDVEYPLMNMAKYDVRILGNHEFDNGLKELAKYYKDVEANRLSANYDFTDTPLKGMFDPYVIKKVAGKKVGFIGINTDPESLISKENYEGMKFRDVIETANSTAAYLKNDKKCDLVVVVSHIGVKKENEKTTDYELAKSSKDIDIIIGGHSHTVIEPGQTGQYPNIVENANGRPVLICQTGKYGKLLGYIKIDLDALKKLTPAEYDYELIKVTDRFPDSQLDKKMKRFIAPYKHVVDSVNNRVIAQSMYDLKAGRTGGYPNWAGDFAMHYATQVVDSMRNAGKNLPRVDFGLMNVGGIRHDMEKGKVTEGQILSTFPFSNHLVVARIKGSDFIKAMEIAARKGGEAVSDEIRVVSDKDGNLVRVVINGEEMDPDKEYTYATIDYLFWGNDDLKPLANSELLWRDAVEVSVPILEYVETQGKLGLPIAPNLASRFITLEE
ncbi:MAG: bifunctional metallophosphatase/5'-nucleotidase [Muribaculum sp.]|nr:bifunctional metallophosphatase/5'-nucleotidase [Muribaculum sp.]